MLLTVLAITHGIMLQIMSVYRSLSSSKTQTIEMLHNMMTVMHCSAITSTIVLGDFNEDLLTDTNKPVSTYM